MHDHLAVGTRVRLTRAVDRYPHFIAPEGATGGVVENSPRLVRVRMDEQLEGAEEWHNEIHWSEDDLAWDGAIGQDLEVISEGNDDDDFVTEAKREEAS